MMGVLFTIIVLLMAVGFTAILARGRGMLFVDPQPSYYIVDEEDLDIRDRLR